MVYSSDVEVRNCRIHHNQREGVRVQNATPALTSNVISHNGESGLRTSNAPLTLRGNLFYRNGGYGVFNDTPAQVVDARLNAWGQPSGPFHPVENPLGLGDRVSDGVLFFPWNRTAAFQVPDNTPPHVEIRTPQADGERLTTLPLSFQMWITDTDTTPALETIIYLRAEILREGVLVARYDQAADPTGWDRTFYQPAPTEGVTATLTLTQVLPSGDYTLRVVAFDGLSMGPMAERTFRVALPSWGIVNVQPDAILGAPHLTYTLSIHGIGFQNDLQVWLETQFISGTVVQTVRHDPSAVRVVSTDTVEIEVGGLTYPALWDVVVAQYNEQRRIPVAVLPYLPIMRIDYERSPVFSPGRNWEHGLNVANEGSAAGVAIVALRPPTGTLLVETSPNAEVLGDFDTSLGKVYFVAVPVDPGQTEQVKLVYNLPWSAVGIEGGLSLGDPIDFGYYGVAQPLRELWDEIRNLAREGNENDPQGYLDDLLTLSFWASGDLQGWAYEGFRTMPDEARGYDYLDRVYKHYPMLANVLMAGLTQELAQSFQDLVQSQGAETARSTSAVPSGGTVQPQGLQAVEGFRQWIYDFFGPDPGLTLKLTLKYAWEDLTAPDRAVFLVAQAEGFVSNLTFGLVKPDFGAEFLARELCVSPDYVRVGRFTGELISFGATLGAATATRNLLVKLAKTPAPSDKVLFFRQTRYGKYVYKIRHTRGSGAEPTRWGYDFVVEMPVHKPGPRGFVMVGQRMEKSYNLFHWGIHEKFGPHWGWGWASRLIKVGEKGNLTKYIVTAGPHVYPDRLYIPWWSVGEVPITRIRPLIKGSAAAIRGISAGKAFLTPVEIGELGQPAGCMTLRGAFDPNEIVAVPEPGFIRSDKGLDITIYFENLPDATDPAEKVEITMTIPSALDMDSIQILGSSHPMTPTLDPDQRVLRFTFDNINLPPNKTPPEGEGWVRFTVFPRSDLASGTQIRLEADIVFWAFGAPNPPIRTNAVDYTIDDTPPSTAIQEIRSENGEIILTARAEDAHSGIKKLVVIYTADGKRWFTGKVISFESGQANVQQEIRFRPRLGGDLTVQLVAVDDMAHVGLSESATASVPHSIYLPFIQR